MEYKELMERIEADQVKFVALQFTDVTGAVKSLDIPVSRVERATKEGLWFDGSSVEGFARIQESDMRLIPELDTYAVLPWSPFESRRARISFSGIPQRPKPPAATVISSASNPSRAWTASS